jgi:SRSO17 transposase
VIEDEGEEERMMTRRQPVSPAPGPLEAYCQHFDALFSQRNQRDSLRRYLEGVLLPQERNKTLTALANTEPVVGAQDPRAQGLQWFLSESTWDPETVNARRVALLCADPLTAPTAQGVLVIDEHGDRKWGTKTAHVGRQYLANLGKTDNGVVSVTSLWADEAVYYPLHYEPYTQAHHFAQGKADPQFRTKRQIAAELVGRALAAGVPCRAVVADSFYGEDEPFRAGLQAQGLGYVLALPPSHCWWHREGTLGSLEEAVAAAPWGGAEDPGAWVPVERHFRDGHSETWGVLEVTAGPYGPDKPERVVVATIDPHTLPTLSTWYLVTNLPAPGATRAPDSALPAADLAEVVRLYGVRHWVEQSYKQTKYALGWSDYQVRSDLAIRRHWALVCCAFAFCWYNLSQQNPALAPAPAETGSSLVSPAPSSASPPSSPSEAGRGENERVDAGASAALLAGGAARGARLVGALDHAVALLARVVDRAPTRAPRHVA